MNLARRERTVLPVWVCFAEINTDEFAPGAGAAIVPYVCIAELNTDEREGRLLGQTGCEKK